MTVLTVLADLVLPVRCVACGGAGGTLCHRCLPVGPPLWVAHGGLAVAAAAPYDGAVRTGLIAYKERGRHDLARPLAALLASAVAGLVRAEHTTVLVGVASARSTARARGGDHVARLARRAARSGGWTTARALRQVRPVHDSAGLGARARHGNVFGSMAATAPPPGAVAVIVDDIITSGATVTEAARALRAAGWPIAGVAVVAATPSGPRSPVTARVAGTREMHSRSPGRASATGLA